VTRIDEVLARQTTTSFEFFPPRSEQGASNLATTLSELEVLQPSFVSVTYGAGGGTRERTHRLVEDLLTNTSMTPMAHLTAVSHTRAQLTEILERHRDAGVRNILALRGDAPRDADDAFWELEHADELVELAREVGRGRFAIGVAAHPEGHPLSTDPRADRRHLATKLALADFAVTQFFFDVEDYLRMVDELGALGCHRPVIAGIMPVTDVRQIERFAQLSGAAFPPDLAERLHLTPDATEVRRIGVEVATELCQRLLDAGAPGLHFYTLNRATATREIHANLDLAAA
jgi:methylenetetrahydrofolate reductase (NADPH)